MKSLGLGRDSLTILNPRGIRSAACRRHFLDVYSAGWGFLTRLEGIFGRDCAGHISGR